MSESLKYRFGDSYHRNVYPKVATSVKRLTDYDFALTDLTTPLYLYAPEIIGVTGIGLGYLLKEIATEPTLTIEQKAGVSSLYFLSGVALLAMTELVARGVYTANNFRTPITEKLGIESSDFDLDEEIKYVIDKVNLSSQAKPIDDRTELGKRVHGAVSDFLFGIDGYAINTSDRIKKSRFSRMLLWKTNSVGLFNPLFHEIIVTDENEPSTYAHEFAHLQGLPQEKDAQLVGVAAQINSEDPYLQYIGYSYWLDMLVDAKLPVWIGEYIEGLYEELEKNGEVSNEMIEGVKVVDIDNLRSLGLNEKIIGEMIKNREDSRRYSDMVLSYSILFDYIVSRVLPHLPAKMRDKISPEIEYYMRRPELIFTKGLRSLILKTSGQKSDYTAYISEPLRLLHSYRIKYLDESKKIDEIEE